MVESILPKIVVGDQRTVNAAVCEALGENNVRVGSEVAVVGDNTYPFDGQRGKVVAIDAGFAQVKFPNLQSPVPLMINLLIPA